MLSSKLLPTPLNYVFRILINELIYVFMPSSTFTPNQKRDDSQEHFCLIQKKRDS